LYDTAGWTRPRIKGPKKRAQKSRTHDPGQLYNSMARIDYRLPELRWVDVVLIGERSAAIVARQMG
jgi:hypothetical protein